MRLRSSAPLILLAASWFAASVASANPTIAGETLQCDGSYATTNQTHTPTPSVRAAIQDTSVGLRFGTARMGVIAPATTRAIWRFDNAGTVVSRTCTVGCASGHCLNYTYTYQDPNGSDNMIVGQCVYDNAGDCATSAGLSSSPQVPMGLAACPGSPAALGAQAGFFPASPLGNAASINGSAVNYGSVTYSVTWDLPTTYTISAWINTASAATMRIISEEGPLGFWGLELSGGSILYRDSRDSPTSLTRGSGLNNSSWHQIHVVRRNGTDIRIYADGALQGAVGVATSTSSFASHPISHPVMIGANEGLTERFVGSIDEIRVTNAALNDDDVRLEYYGTSHKYSSNGGASFSYAIGTFTPGNPTNGDTLSHQYVPGEAYTANSQWIFMAQSTQSASSVIAAFVPVIDTGKPVAPPLTGTPTTTNDISWTWGTPGKICVFPGTPGSGPYYQLVDAVSGSAITAPSTVFHPTAVIGENVPGSPNQLRSRHLILTDVWGTSALSASATAYTNAAAPSGLSFSNISTGSFVATWAANGNPAYTRYELTYALDPAYTVALTTVVALSDNYTAVSAGVGGLTSGTTYYVRVRAFNGRGSDFFGGIGTTFATGSFVSGPGAPTLSGAPLSTSSIKWTWSTVPGATGFTLYDSPTSAVMAGPGAAVVTFTSSTLSANTRYDAEVEATLPAPTPPSPRGHAFTYTWANPPSLPVVSGVFPTSVTFSWNANGNPAGTFYQVFVASDPAYSVVVATLSANSTSVTATGLLPGVAYYARVQAVNGVQVPTAYANFAPTATLSDASITVSSSPATPYVPGANLVGAWQFDEGTGTVTLDGSVSGSDANLTCVTNGCTSTPTWISGPVGLGSAASFSGLAGAVRTNSAAPFAFTDDLTVEAWVNPQTVAEVNGAGIVARGNAGSEDFALDVSGGKFRFIALPAKIATAPSTVAAGFWSHVVGVYDSVAQTATLYVNGSSVAVTGSVVGPRSNSGQLVDIGNRRNAGGTETLAFAGGIDSVRIYHRALSAAEVLSDYRGGFVSSVTAPSPNTGVIVALPPNAFGAPAQIYISADPMNHPVRIPAATLNAGLANTPSGLTLVPSTLVEIVPVVGGVPFTTTLGSSATLTIPYLDANNDNLIDNTSPPLAASNALMYTLNTTVNRWEQLPTSVDRTNRRITGVTPHFSVFALFAPSTVGANLNTVRAYPVPWKPGTGSRFDAPGVTFANLPSSGVIRILTLAGVRVKEISFNGNGAGTAVWDGTNDDGRRAASGVYFAKISANGSTDSTLIKFAVER